MALVNPNIALAGQQFQVPNMLGMAAEAENIQNMQVDRQAALQEMDRAQYTHAIAQSKEALRFVQTPDQYLSWMESSFNDPVVGGMLKQMGVDPAQARSQVMAELQQPGGFERAIQRSAASISELGNIMGQRVNAIEAQRQAAADRAAAAREQGILQSIMSGQGMPTSANALATGGGAPTPPRNALVAPPSAPAGASIMTPEATAAAPVAPAAVPTMGEVVAQPPTEADQLRYTIGRYRQAAALGVKGAANAADQLEKQLKLIEPSDAKNPPAAIQEYEYATSQGYTGSFADFRREKSPMFEPTYAKVVGEKAAERDNEQFSAAGTAASSLPKIYETLNQIESSDAITGFGADVLKNVERFRAQFTADKAAGKRVADTEILDALLGSDVFPMIGALGIGARGLDTPAEREFLRQVMTGTISMDKKALVRLTEIRKNIAERAIDSYNQRVEKGELDRFFEVQGMRPQKIEKPTRQSAMTAEQRQALEWANSNPNDPRSAQIKSRLGM